MEATVTKTFEFSASHSDGARVIGHNYVLKATFGASRAADERGLAERIDEALIRKVHSRDLGQHVDFLKGVAIDDLALLRVFWPLVSQAARPLILQKLSLRRDRGTCWTLRQP